MQARNWGLGITVAVVLMLLGMTGAVWAQEPTPTPMPTLTPIPTRTPVVTPAPTPYFNDSTPSNWVEGITRSFAAAIQTAQTLKTAVGTSLIGKVNEYGNDFCVATGVVYGGDSIIGSYLTTILLSISGAMLIISLVRLGLWVVKFILDLIKIF